MKIKSILVFSRKSKIGFVGAYSMMKLFTRDVRYRIPIDPINMESRYKIKIPLINTREFFMRGPGGMISAKMQVFLFQDNLQRGHIQKVRHHKIENFGSPI